MSYNSKRKGRAIVSQKSSNHTCSVGLKAKRKTDSTIVSSIAIEVEYTCNGQKNQSQIVYLILYGKQKMSLKESNYQIFASDSFEMSALLEKKGLIE